MKKFQNIIASAIFAIVGAFIALFVYTNYIEKPKIVTINEPSKEARYTSLPSSPQGIDLTYAAERSVKGVVHIQTQVQQRGGYSSGNPFFDFFFGEPYRGQEPRIQEASGSGVIISPDGFIVTNNHVIERADDIRIILNNKEEYEARLIGSDPSTDIALLKIEATDLSTIPWGNSDDLKLGEWVLAVGNPFNLTSTVTAGIVSAKARSIRIISDRLPIESFIQTDAAVNPGNSGGALVNTNGELIGINTAIASRTGSYTGYSFAVPTSIVKKVVEDLKEFGEVQRALLGVTIQNMNSELAENLKLDKVEGVYVEGTVENGAANEAGIKEGDVIISINNVNVNTISELQEQISRYRPGDEVKIIAKRNNKEKLFTATLRNIKGDTEIVKSNLMLLGAELETISESLKEKLNIQNGLIVKKMESGKLEDAGIREGYIITHVNKRKVNSIADIQEILNVSRGGILIEGKYQNGDDAYYVFSLD
jgi:Do/DeqQ family serine protease